MKTRRCHQEVALGFRVPGILLRFAALSFYEARRCHPEVALGFDACPGARPGLVWIELGPAMRWVPWVGGSDGGSGG